MQGLKEKLLSWTVVITRYKYYINKTFNDHEIIKRKERLISDYHSMKLSVPKR